MAAVSSRPAVLVAADQPALRGNALIGRFLLPGSAAGPCHARGPERRAGGWTLGARHLPPR